MRASTLLGLAIALMLGVVVVGGVKYSGILAPKPAPVVPKIEPVLVLAAKRNLYKGLAATINDAGVRAATREELDFVQKNPDKLFPKNPEATNQRILKRNVGADEILLKEYFEEIVLPDDVSKRLEEVSKRLGIQMRTVDIEVPKDRAAAGLLRVGEHVDVLLTSKILTDPSGGPARTGTAPIAKDLEIIVKRDALIQFLAPVPKDDPVSYIVAADPYRAALIEYSKSKGLLTLVASPPGVPGPNAEEQKIEEIRVNAFLRGKLSVSESDLERIFHLPQLLPKQPPIRVEYLTGVKVSRVDEIDMDTQGRVSPAGTYRFVNPDDQSAKVSQSVPAANPTAGPPLNTISPKGPPPAKKK